MYQPSWINSPIDLVAPMGRAKRPHEGGQAGGFDGALCRWRRSQSEEIGNREQARDPNSDATGLNRATLERRLTGAMDPERSFKPRQYLQLRIPLQRDYGRFS